MFTQSIPHRTRWISLAASANSQKHRVKSASGSTLSSVRWPLRAPLACYMLTASIVPEDSQIRRNRTVPHPLSMRNCIVSHLVVLYCAALCRIVSWIWSSFEFDWLMIYRLLLNCWEDIHVRFWEWSDHSKELKQTDVNGEIIKSTFGSLNWWIERVILSKFSFWCQNNHILSWNIVRSRGCYPFFFSLDPRNFGIVLYLALLCCIVLYRVVLCCVLSSRPASCSVDDSSIQTDDSFHLFVHIHRGVESSISHLFSKWLWHWLGESRKRDCKMLNILNILRVNIDCLWD
jgi:hypothetical protein